MDKKQALEKLIEKKVYIQPEQDFSIRLMEPEDAEGVALCFLDTYGEGYPIDTYYIPERLIEENLNKNLITVVAGTSRGDIIGTLAMYRSSSINEKLYEIGQAIVLPQYRSTFAFICLKQFLLYDVLNSYDMDGFFGEAVCNHIITQKMSEYDGAIETGIELSLMPAEAYQGTEPAGRVSSVLSFRITRDRPQEIFIPEVYIETINYLLPDIGLSRSIKIGSSGEPKLLNSEFRKQYFAFAKVLRFSIFKTGKDIHNRLKEEEKAAEKAGAIVFQVFVNLSDPYSNYAITILKAEGYFFGGYLPQWFYSDGLLMQRIKELPDFDRINLYSNRSKRILEIIRGDLSAPSL